MTTEQWFQFGMLLFAGLAALGTVTWRLVIYVDRVASMIRIIEKDMLAKIEGVASSLDAKFNKSRDEISAVKDNYVRRDDLMNVIQRIELAQRDGTAAVNKLSDRFDKIMEMALRAMGGKEV